MDEYYAAKKAYLKKKQEYVTSSPNFASDMQSLMDYAFAMEPKVGAVTLDYGFLSEADYHNNFASWEPSGWGLDAIAVGTSASGSSVIYGTAGMEDLYLLSDHTRATYTYGGEGNAAGAGASASAYVAAIFNLDSKEQYVGQFTSAGVTVSILEVGITASYFWNSTESPFSKYATKGFSLGYAPGAQMSVWWTNTIYAMTWQTR